MSAPQTDPEKEKKRHRPALFGIKATLIYAAILLAGFLVWLAASGETPEEEGAMIDGRTGETVETGN